MTPLEEHLLNRRKINKRFNAFNTIAAFALGIIAGLIIYEWNIKRNEEDELDVSI